MPTDYYLARVPDGALIRFARELMKIDEGDWAGELLEGIQIGPSDTGSDLKAIRTALSQETFLLMSLDVQLSGSKAQFRRGKRWVRDQSSGTWSFVAGPHPFVDVLLITGPSQALMAAPIMKAITSLLNLAPPIALNSDPTDVLDQTSSILNRIAEATAQLMDHTATRQSFLDQEERKRQKDADAKMAKWRAEFDTQIAREREELRASEAAEQAREKALDDRSNTHVRRDLQTSMARLSDDTVNAGWISGQCGGVKAGQC